MKYYGVYNYLTEASPENWHAKGFANEKQPISKEG